MAVYGRNGRPFQTWLQCCGIPVVLQQHFYRLKWFHPWNSDASFLSYVLLHEQLLQYVLKFDCLVLLLIKSQVQYMHFWQRDKYMCQCRAKSQIAVLFCVVWFCRRLFLSIPCSLHLLSLQGPLIVFATPQLCFRLDNLMRRGSPVGPSSFLISASWSFSSNFSSPMQSQYGNVL